MSEWINVAKVNELAPGERRVIDVNGTAVIVLNVNGEYFAVEDRCTHDGGSFDDAEIEGDAIICPRHGASFCIKTGEVLSPPAYEPISTFLVRVENNIVQVKEPD